MIESPWFVRCSARSRAGCYYADNRTKKLKCFGKLTLPVLILLFCTVLTPLTIARTATGEDTKEPAAARVGSIIVTIQKREADARDISSGISVISEIRIENHHLDTPQYLVPLITNLYVTDTGNAAMPNFAAMRGIAGFMSGIPALGFYVDDVYYSGLDMGVVDIERIEVLRGPQGTQYGGISKPVLFM